MSRPQVRRRVPRNTVSRARIVDAALALTDDDGLSALSMPRLAGALGVGVMTLYTHVSSKDDLLDAMTERILGEFVAVPDVSTGVDAVLDHFRVLRGLLVKHRALGEMFGTRGLTVPATVTLIERGLTHLLADGVQPERAVRTYYALLTYTLGFVAWQLPRAPKDDREYKRRWREVLHVLPREDFPSMHRLAAQLTTVASDAQFEFGLRQIVADR